MSIWIYKLYVFLNIIYFLTKQTYAKVFIFKLKKFIVFGYFTSKTFGSWDLFLILCQIIQRAWKIVKWFDKKLPWFFIFYFLVSIFLMQYCNYVVIIPLKLEWRSFSIPPILWCTGRGLIESITKKQNQTSYFVFNYLECRCLIYYFNWIIDQNKLFIASFRFTSI